MPDPLDEVLRQAQDLGLLGPGSVSDQRHHAEAFCRLATADLSATGPRFVDLGSGGGLPGLVLATSLPSATGTLLDRRERRGRFLERAVRTLGMASRITVVTARAEDAARDPAHRERYDLAVVRSFGPPAVAAECATAFLMPGARLAVSEPPAADPARWDEARLAALGLSPPTVVRGEGATVARFEKLGPTAPRWPRRSGIPQKRPLW